MLWIFALAVLQAVHADDTVSSGNYLIHRCNSGQPDSQASKLQSLLPQVYDGILKVIADLQLGTASTHGYSTFFKDDSSKAEISQVFLQMAAGANVMLRRAGNNGVYIRRPTFICANDVPETDLVYSYCTRSNAPLVNWLQTELIALCPIFWTVKQQARSSDCPLVVANNLAPNDDRLLKNQEALLVGSLMHFYHDQSARPMLTAIADASELDNLESKLNAPSYALYYAGKCSTF